MRHLQPVDEIFFRILQRNDVRARTTTRSTENQRRRTDAPDSDVRKPLVQTTPGVMTVWTQTGNPRGR